MPPARITIDAPRSLHTALKRGASKAGLPMAEYVRRAISEKLKTQPGLREPASYRNHNT